MAFLTYEHKDGKSTLELEGNVIDIVTEVAFLIKRVHTTLHRDDPSVADIFESMLRTSTREGSPVWIVSAPTEDEVTEITSVPKVRPHDDDV